MASCDVVNSHPVLSRSDLTLDPMGRFMLLHLSRSKTDPCGRGATIAIGASPDVSTCPVKAMQVYLTVQSTTRQLFAYTSGVPLTRVQVTSELRTLLSTCGVVETSSYASHSFRIGAATSAAIAQVPEHLIRHMGSLEK